MKLKGNRTFLAFWECMLFGLGVVIFVLSALGFTISLITGSVYALFFGLAIGVSFFYIYFSISMLSYREWEKKMWRTKRELKIFKGETAEQTFLEKKKQ